MACYITTMPDGTKLFMTGELGNHCADCADVGDYLCDYPVGNDKTCDRSMCENHSTIIAPSIHYCEAHYKEYDKFREAGGVKAELENVMPFKKPMTHHNRNGEG